MTQITVSAGSAVNVTLPADNRLVIGGSGIYRVGPLGTSQRPTVDQLIDTTTTVGPFEDSCVVSIRANGGGAVYEVIAPTDALDSRGLPALVSDAGIAWADRPSAAGNQGRAIRVTDVGNSAAGTLMVSDGVYWRPVGGQCHIVERSGSPFYPLTQNTGSTGFNFTLPAAGIIPADFLIPGESQIECEVWVKKSGAGGTATLNVYLGLNNSNATDYRIVQGTFAAADGSELGLRPLVTVGNAVRFSSSTFLSVGTVSAQTNPGTDSAGGMCSTAVPTYLTINIGAANAADTFRLLAYRLTVKQ